MKLLILSAAVAALFLMSEKANAEIALDTVGVHVGSVHSNEREQWNNSNPGIYGVFALTGSEGLSSFVDGKYVVGTYYNSIRQQSYYVGRVFEWEGFGLIVGLITGYDGPGRPAKAVMPMVVPSYRFTITQNMGARISVAPKVDKGGATAVHLSLEWKF